jgi:hypothetical protein
LTRWREGQARNPGPPGAQAQIREAKDQVLDQTKNSLGTGTRKRDIELNDSPTQAADRIGNLAKAGEVLTGGS